MAVRRPRLPLAQQLVAVQLALILAVLVCVSAVSVEITRLGFARDEGRRALTLAENLAANPVVRSPDVRQTGAVLPAAVAQLQTVTGVDLVAAATPTGIVVASTDPLLLGDQLPWPELLAAPGRSHSGAVTLDGQAYVLAAAPVLSSGSPVQQVGIALVGQVRPTRTQALASAAPALLTYLGAALLLGLLGSLALARWIKRGTLGMEPAQIAGLVEQREAIFAGIAEGVIALDPAQRVTLVNQPATTLLSLPTDPVGLDLDQLGIRGRLRDVLTGVDGAERDAVVLRSGRVLVLNRMPVSHEGRHLGSVTTLRDGTQLAELERELGAYQGTADLLRAQAHEFANQLHTIAGLIQIGDYDEVVGYVQALSDSRAAVDLTITQRVRDSSVAALLVAKSAQAAERRVELRVGPGSAMRPLEPRSSFDVATVLGNLVQNGVDAVSAAGGAPGAGWVEVDLHQTGDVVEIVVRDSGPGLASTTASEVFEHGFTTKAARDGERGIGLALTRRICRTRGGDVEVRASEGGAEFAAWMTVKPAPAVEARAAHVGGRAEDPVAS
ncbi:sensor histidine kinase [Microlunatus flavus]|uniref:histidine kinase n=1 Tax=Microlunatus flavus TaxID=1036181 RepID=A0A1H9AUZ6_9ACTN|nr:ATP-binding protein [Microlunatus flavus]SEP80586.1 Sensor histidine kinase regulating citrate/malate metabolism [Microlunatus flavus]